MALSSQKSSFSTEPSTKGFDNSAGNKWIYPDNYPLRDYQFNIVQSALYHNTLVCLPTGLGKTFIAAVVMYNFWRWYPQGKIVFLAPTKPLVAQQIKACYEIMGISNKDTVELTGAIDQKKRQAAWSLSNRARVVFATPQVFQKDLEKDIIPTELVKCIVVDEAHRALGKHSYCESIRLLSEKSKYFRILGLSATPGSKLDAVQSVITNLRISRLELRDDDSPDIMPYINERKLDIIVVGLGDDLERFKERYIEIMDPHVRVLVENNVLRGNTGNLSKGRIFHIKNQWQQNPNKGHNHGFIMKTLTILMTMYHAYELMIRHGLRAFYNFYQKHEDKFWRTSENTLKQLLEEVNYFLGPLPDVSRSLPGESFPNIPEGVRFGHNKFHKLKDLLLQHFEKCEYKEEKTRAIVFVEFRDMVDEIYVSLLQSLPLLRPQKFVGQAGQKQREQKKALDDFRNDRVNVLISTSVGEEGLDVGEVDLIVCFDINNVSPIRLVQRMGRTGRKRDGHIVVLVTDGKEHQALKSSMSRRDSLNSKVLHSSGILSALYRESPRMVPEEFQPECRKMCVTAPEKEAEPSANKGRTKKNRKREENAGKKQAKNPVPSASQTLMKFFKRAKDKTETEVDDEIAEITVRNNPRISQSSEVSQHGNNAVKPNNVKLLTSDDAAVEFLTLCAMKRSQCEDTSVDEETKKRYFPSYHEKPEEMDFDFEIPDVGILDRLKTLEPCVDKPTNNDDDDDSFDSERNQCFCSPRVFNEVRQSDPDDVDPACDSRFEALLDDSTGDTEKTYFEPLERENDVSVVDEKVDWDVNVEDFDDSMGEWSDDPRMSSGNRASWEKREDPTSKFEIFGNSGKNETSERDGGDKFDERTKDRVDGNSTMEFGVFEDLLNESATSSENEEFRAINDAAAIDNSGAFEEDSLNEEGERGGDNYDSDATIDGLARIDDFEIPKSAKSDCVEKSVSDKSGAFEDLLNSTSNDSETRANVEFRYDDFRDSGFNSTKLNRDFRDKKTVESPIAGSFTDAENSTGGKFASNVSIDEIDQESIDLLAGYDLKASQNSEGQKSEVESVAGVSKVSFTPANSTPETSGRVISRMTLKSLEVEAIEEDGAGKTGNSRGNVFVNKKDEGDASFVRSDSSSPSPRRVENAAITDLTSSGRQSFIAKKCESDEDIFDVDDLSVDSEFEARIKEIERSASENEDKKNPDSSDGNVPGKIVERSERNFEDKKFVKVNRVSPTGSLRVEVNLDWSRINREDSEKRDDSVAKSSTSKSLRWEIDCRDWNSDAFQVRAESEKSNKNNNGRSGKDEAIADSRRNIVVGDWDSDAFEISAVSSKPSTSDENIVESSKSKEKHDTSGRVDSTVGWLTTRASKSRLSLSKKLSRNISDFSWRRRDAKNETTRGDSDSENDFTVSRLESAISNEIVSDYFARPNPVSAMKKSKVFAMGLNEPVRSTKKPLSLKRNGNADQVDLENLKKFAAPAKYNARDNNGRADNERRKIGVGREKSASCDLERRRGNAGGHRAKERRKMRIRSDFIDDEAEVSTDCDYSSGTSGSDDDLDNFVSYTQNIDDSVDMQAHYLQTVRSPQRPDGFYIRRLKSPQPDLEIYSQPVHEEPNSYLFDSFCVDENDDVFEETASSDEITELERLEMRSKKRKRAESSDSRAKRKRKIVVSADISSEDEMEKIREQLHEESLALKKRRV